ncbi:hypothetical protein [Marinifilum flexuosum]|uniref:Lipoprotein n=1 Tax=Marinifilum flexuosum TaxID=1117708 RepID=A0A419X9M5_9BACT|nr:hypothetical protein [Marinifilum flexuosum]RKE04432.1 hypothetical protein BXY64_1452 [Marinifilum flexuosum]
MKKAITIILLFISAVACGQVTTFKNNYGANIINGKIGTFKKSSFSWTITKKGNLYNIKTNAVTGSFNVVYSHFDHDNKLYVYKANGSGVFDGSVVKLVMTNGKLSSYADRNIKSGNLLTILFYDNSGYLYKLNI